MSKEEEEERLEELEKKFEMNLDFTNNHHNNFTDSIPHLDSSLVIDLFMLYKYYGFLHIY